MIKFPRVHIAASVVNRILNTRDELEHSSPSAGDGGGTLEVPPPVVPDPVVAGAVLEAKVNQPPPEDVPELEPPAPENDELAGIIARGEDLIRA